MQALAPYSVAELRERLIPCGTYAPVQSKDVGITPPEQANILAGRLHLNSFRQGLQFMRLQPLPVPREIPSDLPDRVFPFTVISSDGRAKPTMFGLCIEKVLTKSPAVSLQRHS